MILQTDPEGKKTEKILQEKRKTVLAKAVIDAKSDNGYGRNIMFTLRSLWQSFYLHLVHSTVFALCNLTFTSVLLATVRL